MSPGGPEEYGAPRPPDPPAPVAPVARPVLGLLAAAVAALVGAVVWAVVSYLTKYELGILAAAVGLGVGLACRAVSRAMTTATTVAVGLLAVLGVILGYVLTDIGYVAHAQGVGFLDAVSLVRATYSPVQVVRASMSDRPPLALRRGGRLRRGARGHLSTLAAQPLDQALRVRAAPQRSSRPSRSRPSASSSTSGRLQNAQRTSDRPASGSS